MNFRNCIIDRITKSNFTESQLQVMIFVNTLVKEISDTLFDGMNKGLKFMANSNATITNSTFKNMVQNIKEGRLYFSQIQTQGGAIEIEDSNVVIDNSTFIKNAGTSGGAISIS